MLPLEKLNQPPQPPGSSVQHARPAILVPPASSRSSPSLSFPDHDRGSSVVQATKRSLEERCIITPMGESNLASLDRAMSGNEPTVHAALGHEAPAFLANLSAECASRGRSLLVLSSSDSLLDASQSAINQAGLKELSLRLDASLRRQSIYSDIARTLNLGKPIPQAPAPPTSAFAEQRDIFKKSGEALSTKVGSSGFTLREVLSNAFAHSASPRIGPELSDPSMLNWDPEKWSEAESFLAKISSIVAQHGRPDKNPFQGSRASEIASPDEFIRAASLAYAALDDHLVDGARLLSALGISPPTSNAQWLTRLEALKVIDRLHTDTGALLDHAALGDSRWVSEASEIVAALQRQRRLVALLDSAAAPINTASLSLTNLNNIESAIRQHSGRLIKIFDSTYKSAIQRLEAITPAPSNIPDQLAVVAQLKEIQSLVRQHDQDTSYLSDFYQRRWEDEARIGRVRFWQRTSQVMHALVSFHRAISGDPEKAALLELLSNPSAVYDQSAELSKICDSFASYKKALDDTFAYLDFSPEARAAFCTLPLEEQSRRISMWIQHPELHQANVAHDTLRREAARKGFSFLLDNTLSFGGAFDGAVTLGRGYFNTLARHALHFKLHTDHPSASPFATALTSGAEIYKELLASNAEQAATRHWEGLPRQGSGGQVEKLTSEIKKSRGLAPELELFSSSPRALVRAKPVVLLRAADAEKWLPRSESPFDVVVLDEHSHRDLSDSLLLALRCRQKIILDAESSQASPLPSLAVPSNAKVPVGPIAGTIAGRLKQRGIICHQLGDGSGGEATELAVVSAEDPGSYRVALLLDHQDLDSSAAFEALLNRQLSLEAAGWKVLPQSIVDWFRDPGAMESEVLRACNSPASAELAGPRVLKREMKTEPPAPVAIPYRHAAARIVVPREQVASPLAIRSMNEIRRAVAEILQAEAPMHRTVMLERLKSCAGPLFRAPDFLSTVKAIEGDMYHDGKILVRNEFLYLIDPQTRQSAVALRDRSEVAGEARYLRHVAPEERELALLTTARLSLGISEDEALIQAARLLGYHTLAPSDRELLQHSLSQLKQHGSIVVSGSEAYIQEA